MPALQTGRDAVSFDRISEKASRETDPVRVVNGYAPIELTSCFDRTQTYAVTAASQNDHSFDGDTGTDRPKKNGLQVPLSGSYVS